MEGVMDQLMYQKKLAEYDERINFYKVKAEEIEHEKSRFVLDVLNATIEDRDRKKKEEEVKVIK
jgi:hypothetical protein